MPVAGFFILFNDWITPAIGQLLVNKVFRRIPEMIKGRTPFGGVRPFIISS
jgi:hypothetical protein